MSLNISQTNTSVYCQQHVDNSLYNSRFAKISLASQGIFSLLKSGLYFAASKILSCKKTLSEKYSTISQEYHDTGLSKIAALYFFSNQLIGSSINVPQNKEDPLDSEQFKKTFQQIRTSIQNKPTDYWYDDEFEFKPQEGICAGMSMDFLSEYFRVREENEIRSPLEQVKKVTEKYQGGGPLKSVQAQYLQESATAYQSCNSHNVRLMSTALFYKNIRLDQDSRRVDFTDFSIQDHFSTAVSELCMGTYEVSLCKKGSGHSIVYQKSPNLSFIFDPNIGSIKISENNDAKDLVKLINGYAQFGAKYNHALFTRVKSSKEEEEDKVSSVVTCFFLDTEFPYGPLKNILEYL